MRAVLPSQRLLPAMERLQLRRNKLKDMPPLPGDIREIILFYIQDIQERINKVEALLCLSDEEEENED
jgi:hypothetical protein